MAILIAFLLVVGACYSPDLPDCRVHCETAADCAPGQSCSGNVCSGATLCPDDSVGTDGSSPPTDAAIATDATDAAPAIDAPGLGVLVVKIEDHGQVAMPGGTTCSDASANHTCMVGITLGVATTLTATPGMNRVFVSWMESCTGTDPVCELTPTAQMTHVTAKFHKDD